MLSLVKIGTRGSKLALYQAELVKSKLLAVSPNLKVEFVIIKTTGDLRSGPIQNLGPGVFTRELEGALLKRQIDLAVHSAKDMATELPTGLEIAAALEREDPRDCLVARGKKLMDLAAGAKVGTSSLRRKSQLRRLRPDLTLLDIRGNLDTRIRKIETGEYDGMVIAFAGLKRLGLSQKASDVFDQNQFLTQAGQGIIAIEIRTNEPSIQNLVKPLNHEETMTALLAERSFLRELEGGCLVPAGIVSKIKEDRLTLTGSIFSLSGDREFKQTISGCLTEAEALGKKCARSILDAGGDKILNEIRQNEKK